MTKNLFVVVVACVGIVGCFAEKSNVDIENNSNAKANEFADAAFYGAQAMAQISRLPKNQQDFSKYNIAFVAMKLKANAEENDRIAASLQHLAPKPIESKVDSTATNGKVENEDKD